MQRLADTAHGRPQNRQKLGQAAYVLHCLGFARRWETPKDVGRPQTREWDTCIHPRAQHTAKSISAGPRQPRPNVKPQSHRFSQCEAHRLLLGRSPAGGSPPGTQAKVWPQDLALSSTRPTRCWERGSRKAWEQDGQGHQKMGVPAGSQARQTRTSSPWCYAGLRLIRHAPPRWEGQSVSPTCKSMQGTPHRLSGIVWKLPPPRHLP